MRIGHPLLALLAGLPATSLAAQEPSAPRTELQDRIVAVAGDSVILKTQLDERILSLQMRGMQLPTDPDGLYELQSGVLTNMIDEAVVLQAALRDTTLTVDDERLDQIVTADMQQRAQTMGGQAALERALETQGLAMTSFREQIRADARRRQLQQQYVLKARRSIRADPIEQDSIRAYFEANRSQIGKRPATVTFAQVVLEPQPSDSSVEAARADIDEISAQIMAGQDFEELATRHSQDPGSAPQGGDLGWFRRNGQLVREFEDVAFSLGSGGVSRPFRTPFGFHIVKVERIRGPERRARHILIRFEIGPEQVAEARQLADSLRMLVENGASVRDLHDEHGAESTPDSLSLPISELNQLPPGYAPALRTAVAGEVLGPIEIPGREVPSFAVLRVLEIRDEGDYTLEDLQETIRAQLEDQQILEKLLSRLREQTYIDVRLQELRGPEGTR